MPRLRVLAGPSPSSLSPISVNTSQAHDISSDVFEGQVVVHIKGFNDNNNNSSSPSLPDDRVDDNEYFARPDRQNVTWSIQVQGRFLHEYSADDILFGNTFDRPLKLPWGTSAVLKFMSYIDPTLTHDLQSSTKPWALSPLISTMPYFAHHRLAGETDSPTLPPFPSKMSLTDDVSQLYLAAAPQSASSSPGSSPASSPPLSRSSTSSLVPASISPWGSPREGGSPRSISPHASDSGSSSPTEGSRRRKIRRELNSLNSPSQRRSYFGSAEKRERVIFGPSDVITTDFCYGFLSFAGQRGGPRLDLPGGISFDLGRYWDGQPVRFVCCERGQGGEGSEPWGRTFWCIAIEIDDSEEEVESGKGSSEGAVSRDASDID